MNGCALDTDVVIAALDRQDAHHARAASAITAMMASGIPLLLSLVNYAETLVRPAENQRSLRVAVDALRALDVQLVAPTPAIAVEAARLHGMNISCADGFALATALDQQASVATFDRRVRRAMPKLQLALPDSLR